MNKFTLFRAALVAILFWLISESILAEEIPGVSAKSYIVTELDGTVIVEHNAKQPMPIASITKLLVAEQITPNLNYNEIVRVKSEDLAGTHTKIKVNTALTQMQLLQLGLVPSNNQAIYALARAHDTDNVINAVNTTAQLRGLTSISIEEPSGLSANNQASAEDLAKFLSIIRGTEAARLSVNTNVETAAGTFNSTNPLLQKPGWNFSISKTGFIKAAGGCLVSLVEIGGRELAVVILGSANTRTRWTDLIKIRSSIEKSGSFWQLEPSTKISKQKRRKQVIIKS